MQPSSTRATAAAPVSFLPAPSSRLLAGVLVPDTSLISRAIEVVRDASEPYLFNHVMRSWLFAVMLAERKGVSYDVEVLAVRNSRACRMRTHSTPHHPDAMSAHFPAFPRVPVYAGVLVDPRDTRSYVS